MDPFFFCPKIHYKLMHTNLVQYQNALPADDSPFSFMGGCNDKITILALRRVVLFDVFLIGSGNHTSKQQ